MISQISPLSIEELRYIKSPKFRELFRQAYDLIEHVGPAFSEDQQFLYDRMRASATEPTKRTAAQQELMPPNYSCHLLVGRRSNKMTHVVYGSLVPYQDPNRGERTATFMGYLARAEDERSLESERILIRALMNTLDLDSVNLTGAPPRWRTFEIERGNPDDIFLARLAMEMGAFPLDVAYVQPGIDIEKGAQSQHGPAGLDLYAGRVQDRLTQTQARRKTYDRREVEAVVEGIHRKEYVPFDEDAFRMVQDSTRSKHAIRHNFSEAAMGWLKG